MDAVRIYGGNRLCGQTTIQGSKNASLPILAATLLIEGTCEIENCPDISDVYHYAEAFDEPWMQCGERGNACAGEYGRTVGV